MAVITETAPVPVTSSTGLPIYQIDTETYEGMIELGLLEGKHVELIDGIMTEVSPLSPVHVAIVTRLSAYLAAFNAKGLLRVQAPMHVTTVNSLPEPDLAVTAEPSSATEHPRGALLVIEVAVSSQRLDRGRKLELYAATGVPVYWVVDVPGKKLEVYTDPLDERYGTLATYRPGDSAPAPLPGLDPLVVAELLRD